MKDPNLHSTIKTLALGYLDYLRKLVEARGGTIPTRTVVEVLVEKAMFPVRDYQEPDYASLVSSSVREFVKSPELQAAVRAVLSNPDVTALLERKTYAQVDHSLTFEILQPLAVRLLEAQHGLEFSDKDFDLVFAQLEDCLESKVDKYLLLTPLSTFSMDMEEAVVGPFTLRKLAPSEIAAFNDIDASAMSSSWCAASAHGQSDHAPGFVALESITLVRHQHGPVCVLGRRVSASRTRPR